ncbi:TetR/AcrR family transcriptional regulator [Alkalibacillus haloalkaliphilus]|uniref:TetR/AcrR family transcriptional regulator n=1 Tax=Alkalibacillus haloalkaliphilus TaxID=94136 RepID=UPI0029367A38|nr:TetR/AcrR family transcriptional regulator [Alkalibacillus haloalkaliphilus]MDV2581829.1 TetR/AcrR family transcriptional regulator [Alkalibacillus haloalkaliphilus]
MSKNSRRIEILNAASKIVSDKGIFNLTLEAVAKEAGISKGGLLYHFPSKEALVEGMVEHLAHNYRAKIASNVDNDPLDKGKWTRAFLNVTFNQGYPNKDMHSGLLAAKAVKPELLEPLHNAYEEWQSNIENDGLDPVDATIIRLATDGIWLSELFEIYQIEPEQKKHVYKRLHEWVQDMYIKSEKKD